MTPDHTPSSPTVGAETIRLRQLVELALHGDSTDVEPWVCIGCGADSPRKIRPCDCPSQLVYVRGDPQRRSEQRAEVGPDVPVAVPAAQLLALLDARVADQAALKVIHDAAFAVRHAFGGRMSEVTRVFENIVRVSGTALSNGEHSRGGEAGHDLGGAS